MLVTSLFFLMAALPAPSPAAAPLDREALVAQADAGDADAIHALCYGHLYGDGLPKDPAAAHAWCGKGAALGLASTQTLFAETYRHGVGVAKDDGAAKRWYTAAAEQGHVHAQMMLGKMIAETAKTTDDMQAACRWLQASADQGYDRAQHLLDIIQDNWVTTFDGHPPRPRFCEPAAADGAAAAAAADADAQADDGGTGTP